MMLFTICAGVAVVLAVLWYGIGIGGRHRVRPSLRRRARDAVVRMGRQVVSDDDDRPDLPELLSAADDDWPVEDRTGETTAVWLTSLGDEPEPEPEPEPALAPLTATDYDCLSPEAWAAAAMARVRARRAIANEP